MSSSSGTPWNLLALRPGPGRGRNLAMALTALAAVVGTLFAVGMLWRRVKRRRGRGVLLVQARKAYTVRLEHRESLTHNVRLFRFALPYSDQILGVPVGHHVYLRAIVGGRLAVRPYTPVSPRKQEGSFELIVKIYTPGAFPRHPTGGHMSQYLDQLKIGDTVEVHGPKGIFEYLRCGEFSFRDGRGLQTASQLGLVAAGSGITPILQMLRHIFGDPEDETEVRLVDVNNSEEDIIVRDELDDLARDFPGRFRACHVLSKLPELVPEACLYLKGPVSREILANHLFRPGPSTMVLLCGPPKLVNDVCRPALAGIGHGPSRVVVF